jgi:hypothetical protein
MPSVPGVLELLLFGTLSIPLAVAVQTPAPTSVPALQTADTLSFPKEATVIEDLQVKARFENDGKAVYETLLRAKIQSESAVRDNGLIAFSYFASNESFAIKYVRVRKPDGTLIETPLESVQDLTSDVAHSAPMYTDQHEKHVAVKGLSVGDTLEYRTVSITNQPSLSDSSRFLIISPSRPLHCTNCWK